MASGRTRRLSPVLRGRGSRRPVNGGEASRGDRGPLLRALGRCNDVLETVQIYLALLCFIAFVTITATEAFSRYVLNHSLLWTNEIARLLFVWSVFLSAAVGFRHQEHLAVDLMPIRPGSRLQIVQHVVVTTITLLMCVAWAYFGFRVLTSGMLREFAILGIPIGYGFAAIPVMGFTATLYLLENLFAERALKPSLAEELRLEAEAGAAADAGPGEPAADAGPGEPAPGAGPARPAGGERQS